MKYVREWLAVTLALFLATGSLAVSYRIGTQAHTDRLQAQQDKISALTQVQQNQQETINRQCKYELNDWDRWQRVIGAATNPPSQAGRKLTDQQVAALNAYRESLIMTVGPQPPNC